MWLLLECRDGWRGDVELDVLVGTASRCCLRPGHDAGGAPPRHVDGLHWQLDRKDILVELGGWCHLGMCGEWVCVFVLVYG